MKAAIYIEQKSKKTGEALCWACYIYADKKVNPSEYTFVKDSKDQWEKPVKVYKAKEKSYLETPGGVQKSDLVVLFS